MSRNPWDTSVYSRCRGEVLLTHEAMRNQSSHHRPCRLVTFAYIRSPRNPPEKKVNHQVTPTINGPLSGMPIVAASQLAHPTVSPCRSYRHMLHGSLKDLEKVQKAKTFGGRSRCVCGGRGTLILPIDGTARECRHGS